MCNDINIIRQDQFIVVKFIGDVDSSNVKIYRKRISDVIEKSKEDVVFDFSKSSLIDSSGIGLILGRYNQLKFEHRTLMIVGLNPVAYRLFELTGLFQIIPYFHSIKSIKEGVL